MEKVGLLDDGEKVKRHSPGSNGISKPGREAEQLVFLQRCPVSEPFGA